MNISSTSRPARQQQQPARQVNVESAPQKDKFDQCKDFVELSAGGSGAMGGYAFMSFLATEISAANWGPQGRMLATLGTSAVGAAGCFLFAKAAVRRNPVQNEQDLGMARKFVLGATLVGASAGLAGSVGGEAGLWGSLAAGAVLPHAAIALANR